MRAWISQQWVVKVVVIKCIKVFQEESSLKLTVF